MEFDHAIRRRLDEVITRWNLHEASELSLPVPIELVARHEGWRIGWGCEWPVYGFAVYSQASRTMRINESLSDEWIRFTIAHEMGHEIAGHGYGQYAYAHGPRDDPREREADLVALELLIPRWLRDGSVECAEVARRCRVPLPHVQWFWQVVGLGGRDADDETVSQRARGTGSGRSTRPRGLAIGRNQRSAAQAETDTAVIVARLAGASGRRR